MSSSDPSAPDELSSKFASQFKTSQFTIYVGPEKTPYNLHRDLLIRRCPYFRSLCSFSAAADSSSNYTHLDTAVDTEQAFDMFVEFIYGDIYTPPEYLADPWKVQVHGEVYVLAERLMMPDLKDLALRYMVNSLAYAYDTKQKQVYDPKTKAWETELIPMMESACIVNLIDIVYSHTAQRHPSNDENPSETPEIKEKGKVAEGSNAEEVEEELKEGPTKNGTQPFPSKLTEQMLPKDPMRRLIARYCASRVLELQKVPEFLKFVREKGEFAEDLFMELDKERTRVKIDEMNRLCVS
ncbi:hypothetical protein BDD12DRAFT_890635 [Trichophaea hybrida]|nr:hypothetical protein BDD12DRAFT_890635 [Trichophaea hybrida]